MYAPNFTTIYPLAVFNKILLFIFTITETIMSKLISVRENYKKENGWSHFTVLEEQQRAFHWYSCRCLISLKHPLQHLLCLCIFMMGCLVLSHSRVNIDSRRSCQQHLLPVARSPFTICHTSVSWSPVILDSLTWCRCSVGCEALV